MSNIGSACQKERNKRWPRHMRCTVKISGDELRSPSARRAMRVGCVGGIDDTAFGKHRHLHRLVSVGNMP